jgi:hypothetical protein
VPTVQFRTHRSGRIYIIGVKKDSGQGKGYPNPDQTFRADFNELLLISIAPVDHILIQDDPQDAMTSFGTLPTDLSEAYKGIVERMKEKKAFDSSCRILSWLFQAYRPLVLGELMEALSIEKGNTNLDSRLFISTHMERWECPRMGPASIGK